MDMRSLQQKSHRIVLIFKQTMNEEVAIRWVTNIFLVAVDLSEDSKLIVDKSW